MKGKAERVRSSDIHADCTLRRIHTVARLAALGVTDAAEKLIPALIANFAKFNDTEKEKRYYRCQNILINEKKVH